MPFVYDQTQVEWPDDDSEPAPPRPDQFVYIPAPEFGGARGPVRFEVPPLDAPAQAAEPDPPSSSSATPSTESVPAQRGSFWGRLLGWPPAVETRQRLTSSQAQDIERRKREQARRRERLLSIMVHALRQIGGRRVYCRYDGGNDEGWAWFDSVELQHGRRLDLEALAQQLQETEAPTRLSSAGFKVDQPRELEGVVNWQCQEWASMLLGQSFGTGEYWMYGAFAVDLQTCTITDDPGADPVVENIRIAQ